MTDSDRDQTSFPQLTAKDQETIRDIQRQAEAKNAAAFAADFPDVGAETGEHHRQH